jgi:hypothetical protein
MAWLSDRTDVFFIWKLLLKSLSEIMPCSICRYHLAQYLNSNPVFMVSNIHLLKGSDIKNRMINTIWKLHNNVNIQNGKGAFTIEQLNMVYLGAVREKVIGETQRILAEIYNDWEPIVVKQITGGALREWRAHTTMFLSLVSGGPN